MTLESTINDTTVIINLENNKYFQENFSPFTSYGPIKKKPIYTPLEN